jgi:hypothetical protein
MIRSSLTLHAAQAVYQLMIAPTMTYCHFVYLEFSNSFLAKLQLLENQALDILNGLRDESVTLEIHDFKSSVFYYYGFQINKQFVM